MTDERTGYGYKIVTDYSPDLIQQRLEPYGPDVLNLVHATTLRAIRLQDEGVRQALIALGWTPPPAG
jgi:hypothetical protein